MEINSDNSITVKEPAIFHDFLGGGGESCDADPPTELALPSTTVAADGDTAIRLSDPSPSASSGPFSPNSDLASGRHFGSQQHGSFKYHLRSDHPILETSNRFIGTKRVNSDASFPRTPKEVRVLMPQVESEPTDRLHPTKNQILWNQASGECARIMLYDKVSSQVPRGMRFDSGSIPQIGTTSDVNLSTKWENPVALSVAGGTQYITSAAQPVINSPFGYQVHSSACQDSRPGPPGPLVLSDEGSRTGIESSRLSSLSRSFIEKNLSTCLLSNNKITSAEPQTTNSQNQHALSSVSRQMTIIYGGQVHVFDDVQPKKADIIMSLAGSDRACWSAPLPMPSLKATNGEYSLPS